MKAQILLSYILVMFLTNSSAKSVSQYSQTQNLLDSPFGKLDVTYSHDFGYGTNSIMKPAQTYNGGIFDVQTDGLGLHLYSEIIEKVEYELFNFYKGYHEFKFQPFFFEPIRAQVQYVRFEDTTQGTFIYFSLERFLTLMDFSTEVVQETKTAVESMVDKLQDSSSNTKLYPDIEDFQFDKDYRIKYQDPYWKYNVLVSLTDIEDQEWYGQGTYWSYTIQ
eukprot:403357752